MSRISKTLFAAGAAIALSGIAAAADAPATQPVSPSAPKNTPGAFFCNSKPATPATTTPAPEGQKDGAFFCNSKPPESTTPDAAKPNPNGFFCNSSPAQPAANPSPAPQVDTKKDKGFYCNSRPATAKPQ